MARGATKSVFLKDFLGNFLGGIDGGVDPHLLKKDKLAWAVNSTVRGGFIGPMPKILSYNFSDGGIPVIGGSAAVSYFVQNGVFQGATPQAYQPHASSILPGPTFFALISGRLFGFTPDFSVSIAGAYVASPGMIAVVEYTPTVSGSSPVQADLNSATAPQAWLDQAENYLIVQDGTTPNPLVFDGNKSFRSYSLQQVVGTFSNGTALVAPVSGGVIVATVTTDITTIDPKFFNIPVALYAPSGGIAVGISPVTPAYAGGQYIGQMALTIVPPMTGGALLSSAATGTVKTGDTIFLQNSNYPISNPTINIGGSYPIAYSPNPTVNTADANNAQNTTGFVSGSLVAVATVAQWAAVVGSPYGSPLQPTGQTAQVTSNSITPSMIAAGSFTIPLPSDPYGSNSQITAITLQYQTQATVPVVSYAPIGTIGGTGLTYSFPNTALAVVLSGGASYPTTSTQGATVFVGSNTTSPAANLQCTIDSPSTATTYYLTNNSVVAGIVLQNVVVQTVIGIPCGKAWTYCQGRIWTSLPNGTQFVAGDAVGSSSGTAANGFLDAILYTMQNTLLSNGGTFSIPGNYGTIRALVVAPTMNVQLGQGPLQVFTTQSVFSVSAPADMTTWPSLTTPIVTVSLIGAGGLSQWSTIPVNGDILFRAPDGIRSMTIASLDFYKWNSTPCSQEVHLALDSDNPSLINFCSAIQFDNRVIFGCSPVSGINGAYFQNAAVMNLDAVSNLQNKSPAVWEGEWTGLNTLQWMTGIFGNKVRCFSFTSNGTTIGFSELLMTADGQDITGTTTTTWQFESSVLFGRNESAGEYDLLRLEDGEVYVQNIIGQVGFMVEFRPDYDTLWHPWYSWSVDNTKGNVPYAVRMGLGNPIGGASVSGTQYRDGYDFQVRVTVVGSCNFMGLAEKASVVPQSEFARPIIPIPPTPPTPPAVLLKQMFAASGAPTTQNPGNLAGIYWDVLDEEFYLWLGTQWDTGITPTGSFVICTGRQAFAGSGAPTVATPTPANNAGTYFDYTNRALYFWNPAGYWGSDTTAIGSGVIATSLGSDYISGHGVPLTQKPANGAGIYYDLDTLTVYNWNPITQTWL